MLEIVICAVVAIVVVVLVIATMKPATMRIERATRIQASPAKIFPYVNDFRRWREWSAYENLDADLKRSLSGAESGKGAVYEWAGRKAGTGRMEITQSTPPSRVLIKLDFLKPFEGHNVAEFTFRDAGGATEVTWVMSVPRTSCRS
jgi:Polyketide cyclase / dehydrase and lipid transport